MRERLGSTGSHTFRCSCRDGERRIDDFDSGEVTDFTWRVIIGLNLRADVTHVLGAVCGAIPEDPVNWAGADAAKTSDEVVFTDADWCDRAITAVVVVPVQVR